MPQPGQTEANAQVIAEDREAQCVLLYSLGGMTLLEIAREVGYADASGAKRAIDRAMRKRYQETTEHRDVLIQRHLEITRQMIRGLAPKIVKGDTRSVEVGVRVLEREAKLLGLDAPIRVDAKVTDAMTAEIAALVDDMAQLDAVEAQNALARARG